MKRSLMLAAALVLAASAAARADDADNPLLKQVREKVGSDDKPFALVVRLKVKSGSEKKFAGLAAKAAKGTRTEKGNLAYEFYRDTEEPSEYVLFERWKDLPALRAHFGKDYLKEFLDGMHEVADGAPQLRVLIPVGGE